MQLLKHSAFASMSKRNFVLGKSVLQLVQSAEFGIQDQSFMNGCSLCGVVYSYSYRDSLWA